MRFYPRSRPRPRLPGPLLPELAAEAPSVAPRFPQGHLQTVTEVAWSRNGQRIVSSSIDCTCIVWQVATGERVHQYQFEGAVMSARFHPRDDRYFVACPVLSAPVFVDTRIPDKAVGATGEAEGEAEEAGAVEGGEGTAGGGGRPGRRLVLSSTEHAEVQATRGVQSSSSRNRIDQGCVAAFNKRGTEVSRSALARRCETLLWRPCTLHLPPPPFPHAPYVHTLASLTHPPRAFCSQLYVGTPRGKVVVVDTGTLETSAVIPVSNESKSMAAIKHIEFSRSGDFFMVNCADRILRVYRTEGHSPEQKLQDLVNRTQWKTCNFSNKGDYVVAGSAADAQHKIYIWLREDGRLLRMLEGPKVGLLHLTWHPASPIIAATSKEGEVHIWGIMHTENWSAFAPDFKELEENVEYIEREDEFDHVDEQQAKRAAAEEEDEFVDILTVDVHHLASSDEEPIEDELAYIVTNPIEDVPAEPAASANGGAEKREAGTEGAEAGQTPNKRAKSA